MPYEIKEYEQKTPTMVYTTEHIVWGELVHPEKVRVQTWLKMQQLPEYFLFMDANLIIFNGSRPVRKSVPMIHVPVSHLQALHLLPPAVPENVYDENEPNRKMHEISGIMGIYQFEGKMRISTMASFSDALASSKEDFFELYDCKISHPTIPGMRPMETPYIMIRRSYSSFFEYE